LNSPTPPDPDPEIQSLRDEIDDLDEKLIQMLARRNRIVARIARIKEQWGLPVCVPAREESLISGRRRIASEHDVSPDLVESIWRAIISESRKSQQQAQCR
jgi:chorismate mutase / prephenate dehydrogenase